MNNQDKDIMNNQVKKNTEIKILATSEGHIYPQKIVNELFPLLMEYFVGSFKLEKEAISMRFLNGEKFRLIVSEVI